MRRLATLLVIVVISASVPVSAQGPLATAAATAASASALQNSGNTPGKSGMFWAGIALMGSGTTMSILANAALRTEACSSVIIGSTFLFSCIEESNKALWATGVAVSAAGGILTYMGLHRSIAVTPTGVQYRYRF